MTFVYDAFGQLAAEYAGGTVWTKDYVRAGGQIAAIENASSAPCTTCYLSYDYLGSPRMVTDQNANIIARHDYAPFGQEIPGGVGPRTSLWGASDNANQKFTAQERDAETNLDFFQARYLSSGLGRFMSPDPGNAGAYLTNPQSWNGYAYVWDNPLNAVDPTGMYLVAPQPIPDPGDGGGEEDDLGWGFGGVFVFNGPFGSNGQTNAGGGTGGPAPPARTPSSVIVLQTPAKSGTTFTKTYLPGDLFQICAAGNTTFPAPFKFDITKIEAAGRAGGYSLTAMGASVGHYGTFDFQRSRDNAGNTTFYSGFTPVSNFAVGAYMQSAGFSRSITDLIANTFALLKSSNFGDPAQAQMRNLGYDTAAKKQVPFCMNPD
jgi:RHS repeat-associated protein